MELLEYNAGWVDSGHRSSPEMTQDTDPCLGGNTNFATTVSGFPSMCVPVASNTGTDLPKSMVSVLLSELGPIGPMKPTA